MRVRWRARALNDLRAIREWLFAIEGAKPEFTIQRIKAAADILARLGDIGRPSRVEGLRELSVRGRPYVIVYAARSDHFDIIAVYHTSRRR